MLINPRFKLTFDVHRNAAAYSAQRSREERTSMVSILQAAPVLQEGAQERAVYLPGAGPWYDSQSGALVKPDKQGALKVRGGHIIPLRVRSNFS